MAMNAKRRRRIIFLYEVTLPFLALFALFTLIGLGGRYFHPMDQPLSIYLIDHVIWAVFTTDFVVRLCFAPSFRSFTATHMSELAAIFPVIPFIMLNYVFESFGWSLTSTIVFDCVFLVKFLAYLGRAYAMQSRFFRTNLLHYAGGITMVSIVVSALLFSYFEAIPYGDSLWFSIVTMSTTGYGDIVPHTAAGRALAIFLMIAGVACITSFTSILSGRIIKSRNPSGNPHILAIEMQLQRFALLSEEEVEEMCVVLRSLKHHQRLNAESFASEMRTEEEIEENKRWRRLAFVGWIRRKFAGVMGDSMAIDAELQKKKDEKES